MDTSTTTIKIETIIITINDKTLESSKVNSNESKISEFITRRMIDGIIMTEG